MPARSYLYVPADQERLLERAETRGADAVILDLEDSVTPARKAVALAAVLDALSRPGAGERWVRVNGGERGLDEVRALVETGGATGVWLPKAEPGPWLDAALGILAPSALRAGLLIETAAGLARLSALPELPDDTLLQLGEVDLAASLRAADLGGSAVVYRSMVVLECAARGLAAPIAPVSPNVRDSAGWERSSRALRDAGFGGRACIHPAQVGIVNDVFGVTDAALLEARAVLDEFDAAVDAGRGAYADDAGRMVDLATVRSAAQLLGETR